VQHVYWVLPGLLAGRPCPDCEPWDLDELWRAGFRALVTLDRRRVDLEAVRRNGFAHQWYERVDLPDIVLRTFQEQVGFAAAIEPALAFIHERVTASRPTLVHCWAGRDRTGAVLACYLVGYHSLTANQAIDQVRAARPDAMAAPGYTDVVDVFAWQEHGSHATRSNGLEERDHA